MPHKYPEESPFAYVRPTSTMTLSPGNYVDNNGRCYHPYISDWGSDPQRANLAAFLHVLSDAFSKEPPVYSRPTPEYGPPPTYPHQQQSQPAQQEHQHPVAQQQAPATPTHMPITPQLNSPATPSTPVPPLPPKPQQWTQGALHHEAMQFPRQQQYSPQNLPQHQQYPSQHSEHTQIPQHLQQQQQQQQYPQQPMHHPQHFMPPQPPRAATRTDIMDMDTSKSNAAPGPPKPPNPERMKALDKLHEQLTTEANAIQAQVHADDTHIEGLWMQLSSLEAAATTEISLLRQLEAQAEKNNKILSDKMDQARRVITQARACEIPDIDSAVCAENVVFNQLYDLTAQEQAIDDTIYALSLALDREKITVDPFMKHVRNLAREKFMKVATIDKIAVGAGLK